MRKRIALVLLVMAILCGIVLVGCDNGSTSTTESTTVTSTTTSTNGSDAVPEKIMDARTVTVDLYGEDLIESERNVSYVLTDHVDLNDAEGVTFEFESTSDGLVTGRVRNNKFDVTVSTVGEKTFALKVLQYGEEKFRINATVNVVSTAEFGIANGGFETGDLTGWTLSSDCGYVVAENTTYFEAIYTDPVPTVNLDGYYYLDGFNQAGGFIGESTVGTVRSSNFTLGGTGWITFKLGGGSQKGLMVQLVAEEGDEVVATFNNYLFKDPYRSIGMTTYAYKVDERYIGSTMYILISDNTESGSFKAITADSFRTYYPEGSQPTVDNESIFDAKYSGDVLREALNIGEATAVLPNGDFESGTLAGWTGAELFTLSNASQYFADFYPDNIPQYNKQGVYFLTTESGEAGTGSIMSRAFVVDGSRWISFRMGGGKAETQYLQLMRWVENGEDEEIARFNNSVFSDPYRSFGMSKYVYQISEEYDGAICYFVLVDNADSNFGVVTLDEVITYYEDGYSPEVDGVNVFPASFCEAIIVGLDGKLGLDTATNELRNGGFETGDLTGWFTSDLITSYGVYEEGMYFEQFYPNNPPVYGVDGTRFLTGCKFGENDSGLAGMGTIYSQAFVAGGTGWITFKMGGTNNEAVSLKLVRWVENGEDEVIATFNNYLYADPYRSMSMTTYGYKIDAKYLGEKLYFMLCDIANADVAFGAASLDAVKTYYTEQLTLCKDIPPVYTNDLESGNIDDDTNIYPAAYVRIPVEGITESLGLEDATTVIRNGGFETGDMTGWFTDPSGYLAYAVSNENTYFDFLQLDPPLVYNKEGTYFLNGYNNETYAGDFYSQAFIVGGTRWISFRMGGGNQAGLQLRLMKYVDGVEDELIATFNNYNFSDPYRSFAMTEYAYQLDESYAGAKCYFVIHDENGGINFNAITIDDFVTYYETAPQLYYGVASTGTVEDGNIYPAGYQTIPTP